MEIPATVQIIIGALLPPVIYFVNRKVLVAEVRYMIAMGSSIVVGILVALIDNSFKISNPQEMLATMGIVFALSQTTYKMYWEGKIEGWKEEWLKTLKK